MSFWCDPCGRRFNKLSTFVRHNDAMHRDTPDGDGMTTYYVTFHYTVGVDATNQDTADEQAWTVFADALPTLTAGDFVSSEPEEIVGAA